MMSGAPRTEREKSPFSPIRRDVLRVAGISVLAPGMLYGCGGSDSETYQGTIAEGRAAILSALRDPATETSAISVALVSRDRVVWNEAFGVIDQATGAAPDTATLFCIGSVSKMLAAISTMILVDRGLVDLDAPLVRYVTDFRMASPEYTQITVRMLLSHSSGFPGSQLRNLFTYSPPVLDYAKQTQQTLAISRLKHAPGELAVYCNDGFTMIEPLVAAVTGKSYVQFVQDEILTPLGMTRSRYATVVFPAGSYAPAYKAGVKLEQEYVNAYASGGLYSTPTEMAQLAMMLMYGGEANGRRILSSAAVSEMGRDQIANLPFNPMPTYRFGLGWDGVAQPGFAAVGVTVWHK
ncbi:MAG TPA: serine hydrolase domain-containing protein, partial [Burkholderiales bacterium]|nr:serine hydrolase domain-containing protein [Burkholderiales bacterium]